MSKYQKRVETTEEEISGERAYIHDAEQELKELNKTLKEKILGKAIVPPKIPM